MGLELTQLIIRIEELRKELYELIAEKELTDPEIIAQSQMLDDVLNEYNRLIKRKLRK